MGYQEILEKAENVQPESKPKIHTVWKSALCSINGTPAFQAVVGQSNEGFHPGLRRFAGKAMHEYWGDPVPAKEQAVRASQEGVAEALTPRNELPEEFKESLDAKDAVWVTAHGRKIDTMGQTAWQSVGTYEVRRHIGKSSEGYHGGLEVAPRGDYGEVRWSKAHPTQEVATKSAKAMSTAWCQRGPARTEGRGR